MGPGFHARFRLHRHHPPEARPLPRLPHRYKQMRNDTNKRRVSILDIFEAQLITGTPQYEQFDEALVETERLTEGRMEKFNRLRLVECESNALDREAQSRKLFAPAERSCTRTIDPLPVLYLAVSCR
jgi:hypothetical protein